MSPPAPSLSVPRPCAPRACRDGLGPGWWQLGGGGEQPGRGLLGSVSTPPVRAPSLLRASRQHPAARSGLPLWSPAFRGHGSCCIAVASPCRAEEKGSAPAGEPMEAPCPRFTFLASCPEKGENRVQTRRRPLGLGGAEEEEKRAEGAREGAQSPGMASKVTHSSGIRGTRRGAGAGGMLLVGPWGTPWGSGPSGRDPAAATDLAE